MPTGYTADVGDGKVTDLRTFALQCARGMGALIMMRDEPWGTPIPERFEPSNYNAKRLGEAQVEIARLEALTPEQASAEAAGKRSEVAKRNASFANKKSLQLSHYEAMLALVEAWEGAPEGLKEFMTSQLRESIVFDCGPPYSEPLPSGDGAAYVVERLSKARKDVAYHTSEHTKEVGRTESRNAWIAQLVASLPPAVEAS